MSIVNPGPAGPASFHRAPVGELTKLRVLDEPRIAPDIGTVLVRRLAEQGVTELDISFDLDFRILWLYFRHTSCPSFTPELLRDIGTVQRAVRRIYAEQVDPAALPLRYMVWGSTLPTIWNLGGDLRLFAHLIRERNRERLLAYALEVVREGHS